MSASQPRILLVDDDAVFTGVMTRGFQRRGSANLVLDDPLEFAPDVARQIFEVHRRAVHTFFADAFVVAATQDLAL